MQPTLADTQAVTAELAGVPQADMTLGEPGAAVTRSGYVTDASLDRLARGG